jgi:hypothetical protein
MRKMVLVMFAALVVLAGCTTGSDGPHQETSGLPYYLGMRFGELAGMDLYNTPFQITAQYAIEDGPYRGGVAVWLSDTCLLFDSDGILRSISGPAETKPESDPAEGEG